jgi:hypothetical protein
MRIAIALLLLLNAADFALTRFLCAGETGVYEANPVAAWWLLHYGWLGLAGFKFATVLLVVGIATVLMRRRPRLGRGVLALGCAAAAIAVFVGGYLAGTAGLRDRQLAATEASDDAEAGRLNGELARGHDYRTVILHESDMLAADQSTLADSIERLAATDKASDPNWLSLLRHSFGPLEVRQCLALNLVEMTLTRHYQHPEFAGVSERLFRELREICGPSLALVPNSPALAEALKAESRRVAAQQVPEHKS